MNFSVDFFTIYCNWTFCTSHIVERHKSVDRNFMRSVLTFNRFYATFQGDESETERTESSDEKVSSSSFENSSFLKLY